MVELEQLQDKAHKEFLPTCLKDGKKAVLLITCVIAEDKKLDEKHNENIKISFYLQSRQSSIERVSALSRTFLHLLHPSENKHLLMTAGLVYFFALSVADTDTFALPIILVTQKGIVPSVHFKLLSKTLLLPGS